VHVCVRVRGAGYLQKYVGGLEIAVHDILLVGVVKTEQDLQQVAPDRVLGERILRRALDAVVEVTSLGQLHHDVEHVAVDEGVAVLDDVRVIQRCQHLRFNNGLLQLLRRQRRDIDLLDHIQLVVCLPPYFVNGPTVATTKLLQHLKVIERPANEPPRRTRPARTAREPDVRMVRRTGRGVGHRSGRPEAEHIAAGRAVRRRSRRATEDVAAWGVLV
jgi:hypothetical protein